MKIIVFNGPPRSGKSTLARMLVDEFSTDLGHVEFSWAVSDAVAGLYGCRVPPDHAKDKPHPALSDLTWRMAQQRVGQTMKRWHGDEYWACKVVEQLLQQNAPLATVAGLGFQYEYKALVDAFEEDNILLVKTERPGHNFNYDTRSYVRAADPWTVTASSEDELREAAFRIREWVNDNWGIK